jgi:RNA polymerase sigma-70 factor (ECF subfamily)
MMTSLLFASPKTALLNERLQSSPDGIYAAYGTGWEDVGGGDAKPGSAG